MKQPLFLSAILWVALSACSANEADIAVNQDATRTDTISASISTDGNGLSITAPYVVPPFPGRDVAAGFFDITNHGQADRLISASSLNSRAVEIHNHIEDNGVMRMRRIQEVALGAGQTVKFEQGGYHLMLFGVDLEDGQTEIDVTLNYEKSDPVTMRFPLRGHKQKSYGSANHGSGTGADNAKGSGSHGSGSHGASSHGSGSEGADPHYGSGDKSDQ